MIQTLRRRMDIYATIAAMVPKVFMAYQAWFWMGIILNVIAMTIQVFFWRAVYANTPSIAGMHLQQTLTYILLAQIFTPLADLFLLQEFGYNLREGGIANVLLRPLDMQASFYVQAISQTITGLVLQAPLAVVATLLFGLRWPSDPAVWGAFVISAILGRTVMFFFDWLLACFTFYTTEVWGLSVLVWGAGLFLNGTLVPLVMMPGWLQGIVKALPFAQTLYVPLSLLTGIAPLESAPLVWLEQIAWVIGLGVASRLFFRVALRKVTVQGG